MFNQTTSHLACAVALGCALLAPRRARADEVRASAQALFDAAMKAMADRAYDRACPALEEVVRLLPGKVGAMMELSRCYEESGKVASAWSEYRAVADVAPGSDERGAKARAKAAQLAPRVPRLTVTVAPEDQALSGFVVKRDGRDLGVATWNNSLPVDPGPHTVSATAPGRVPWTSTVELEEGPVLVVAVPALVPAAEPGADGAVPRSVSAVTERGRELAHRPPPTWAWVAGGAGLVALGVAAGFGADGLSAKTTLDALCKGHLSPCAGYSATELDPLNARKDRGLALFLGFGAVGVAATTLGAVGLAHGHRASADAGNEVVVLPALGPGLAGAAATGRF
jgi:hypothetical protein